VGTQTCTSGTTVTFTHDVFVLAADGQPMDEVGAYTDAHACMASVTVHYARAM